MICPKCGGKMFKEDLPPSDKYVRRYIGYFEYNCIYCGKVVYENRFQNTQREKKPRILGEKN